MRIRVVEARTRNQTEMLPNKLLNMISRQSAIGLRRWNESGTAQSQPARPAGWIVQSAEASNK